MPVTAIPLRPDKARVGLDIRVVGNDAGEKLSILAGSISRLDRNAPEYGEMTYNDFNTFYLQAASSTSGGSSGSPVIDMEGNAVALQAGGRTQAATDFFFPLDRVVYALEHVQKNMQVPRGTIQAQFFYRPFDEVRRLGFSADNEALVRASDATEIGMLVAEVVLPGGPAYGLLEEGDVLVRVNGRILTKFVPLEHWMDTHIGQELEFDVERGGEPMTFRVMVQDLHSITPSRYVKVGGATLNDLSYQLARSYCVPCQGVYVADPAGTFKLDSTDGGWIVESVDDKPTPNLDALIHVAKTIPDQARIPVVYYSIGDVHVKNLAVVTMDKFWSKFRLVTRNDVTGKWDFSDLDKPLPPPLPLQPKTATFVELDDSFAKAKNLIRSLVKVTYYMPIVLDGYPRNSKQGAGVVVDAERGLIVVGRNIVPFSMGDVTLTFADSIVIPGKVLYLHPTHNVTLLSYDPSLLGNTHVVSAELCTQELAQGHKVTLLAFNHNYRPVCLETVVTDVTCITIPTCPTPRFRSINFDAITLDTPLAQTCSSGMLATQDGKVQALWLSYLGDTNHKNMDKEYHLGLHINTILPMLRPFQQGKTPLLRTLDIEVVPVQMAQARQMGLDEDWVKRVEQANARRHQLFLVRRVDIASPAHGLVKDLDLLLTIQGKIITRISEMDVMYNHDTLDLVVIRGKQLTTLTVPTSPVNGEGTGRLVFWAGAVMQEPHKAVLQQSKALPSRIYVSARSRGSPAYMYGLAPTIWITHINGTRVHTLDDFVERITACKHEPFVRIKAQSFDLVPLVFTIKQDLHYWPTCLMERQGHNRDWTFTDC